MLDKILEVVVSFLEFVVMIALQDKLAAGMILGLIVATIASIAWGLTYVPWVWRMLFRERSHAEWVNPFRSQHGQRKTLHRMRRIDQGEEGDGMTKATRSLVNMLSATLFMALVFYLFALDAVAIALCLFAVGHVSAFLFTRFRGRGAS